ncbi:glutathione S-transferase family protein [Nannocystis punicea]|uniref:Glutathione S-transferase family protein n=1 Tax=Nannocystis punicea TaxID=2995304 RepID=A0ABY7H607_9BACT|nr:glutathione S-transferase family protein [Nannocystis poenicansa]WAS94593.1 glutathione S-transferase family protein [Nannocystis poenicansa]
MSITFYYNPMSSASRVQLTLAELDIPHEKVFVDLQAKDQRKPEFLKLNPNGKIPTIVIDGQPMFESIAIQIYLGERFGVERGLWPALGSREHMQALTWLCWAQVSLGGPLFTYMHNTSEWFPPEARNAKQAETALAEVQNSLQILDARIGEVGNIVHDKWTLVDSDVWSVLGWGLQMAKIDTAKYANLNNWLERGKKRPAGCAMMEAEKPAH